MLAIGATSSFDVSVCVFGFGQFDEELFDLQSLEKAGCLVLGTCALTG